MAAVAAVSLVAAACGSSSTTRAGGATGTRTYTLGVLADETGLGANVALNAALGVKAGVGLADAGGYKVRYVVADTGSTPTGALSAAEKLVDEDHVFAVLPISILTFSAASFLKSNGIPMIGSNLDGPEWITTPSMFSISGYEDYTKVNSAYGAFFKMEGVHNLGAIGYGISPSSSDAAKGAAASAEVAGLKVGYLNANFPFESTNVEPTAIAMKQAGIDGLSPQVAPNTSLSLVTALTQLGVHLKAALLADGYGGDLVSGGAGAQQAAQGVYFLSGFEPVEMHTAATERFEGALAKYAGVTGDPTFGEYLGYLSVDAFTTGLRTAGPDPTQAQLITAMEHISDYRGAGLYGSHSVSFVPAARGSVAVADNCVWVTQYIISSFHLVPHADPICGETVPGKKV